MGEFFSVLGTKYLTPENILLVGSVLLCLSIVVSKTGYKFGVPTLLLFLLVGMFFGNDGLGIQFSNMGTAQFIGMVSLCIILFAGGLDTKITAIKPIVTPGVVLSTVGVFLTALFTGGFLWWYSGSIMGMQWTFLFALLLASTMSSTDSASVFALLRSQKMNLKYNLQPMLELESGSNDPMAYLMTIVLIQIVKSGEDLNVISFASSFLMQFAVGIAVGYALGKFIVYVLNHLNMENISLYPIMVLSFAFFTYAVTDRMKGNGYLAVYLAGLIIGNSRIENKGAILHFMDGLSWLFQIIMFLALGLLVDPTEMMQTAGIALWVSVFMILVGRPLSVFISLISFRNISFKSKLFISWVGLRGAVPIIFATYPVVAGIEGADLIFNVVFFVTITSLIIQGTTISRFAKWLHLDLPYKKEGNDFGVELPEELESELKDMVVTKEMLQNGKTLKEIKANGDIKELEGQLVMIIKRGKEFIVPNGTLELKENDKLLLISEKEKVK